jgi:2-oxoglutarate ferredoxin oxidoreductase subunit alpha
MYESLNAEDAEIIVIGYGIVSRLLLNVMENLRNQGKKVGLIRPITLYPFPTDIISATSERVKKFLVVELSNGQMVDDVRLAVNGRSEIHFYSRMGGAVPSVKELTKVVQKYID